MFTNYQHRVIRLIKGLLVSVTVSIGWVACGSRNEASEGNLLFRSLPPSATGIDFSNDLTYTEELNPYTFRSFYNGGGVGLGDFDKDGLLDVFFAGNLVSNKLYLNQGKLTFKDVTAEAGLQTEGVWSTGVSIVDINSDGYLDIYICKSGPPGGAKRKNELFINNKDLTFSERAADYGLDFEGLSIHAAFFDMDRDGDLDCYLLNNSLRSVGGFDLRKDQRNIPDPEGGNRLLRNDNNRYVDVSQQAGIYSSKIGFGLGVTVGDLNQDGWQDLYVSNDFFEKDYLYINNGNGTFTESLERYMREISLGSMGADMADINNDGLPEIFVTEMLPEDDARLKTTSQFENWDKHRLSVEQGYYHQFSRNTLQLNNGDGTFSEISRLAGTEATDWSWGALIFDMDNNGDKDIFVANGIYKDLINQDYVNFIANPNTVREILRKEKKVIKRLVDSIPSNQLPNYAFRNNGNLTFSNMASEWGLGMATHSNGSAYGDLDNDGDQDLVLNNVNMEASVFQNQSVERGLGGHSLSVVLEGEGSNTYALGAKVFLRDSGRLYYQEISPMRGFMSTVDSRLIFGLGSKPSIDTLRVEWPDGRVTLMINVLVDQTIRVSQKQAKELVEPKRSKQRPVFSVQTDTGVDFVHVENDFVDFDRDRLLFNMISNEGPCACVGDVNGDQRDDFYIGGAKGQAGNIFVQQPDGKFKRGERSVFEADQESEDTDCVFADMNGDGKVDLYVTSGGNEYSSSSSALLDRLYFNQGSARFKKSPQPLPSLAGFESTSTVSAADFDQDGDVDLFVGVRLIPFQYGLPGNGYLLVNDGKGNYADATEMQAPELERVGMITDSEWIDINHDKRLDLVLVGEWMPIKIFLQENGKLVDRSDSLGVGKEFGWYHALAVADLNADEWPDLVVGNHGLNSRFRANEKEPVSLYINDFDQNGTVEHITTRFNHGVEYPLVLRQDLVTQIPSLKKQFLHFKNYKGKQMQDIFPADILKNSIVLRATTFESSVWINQKGASFSKRPLPVQAQFAPMYAIASGDYNGDGNIDLLLGGNQHRAKPETGIYDASYGAFLAGDGSGRFSFVPSDRSGVQWKGEVRAIRILIGKREKYVLVAKNNGVIEFLKY